MKKVILVIALTLPLWAQVKITQQGKEKISVEIDGKPFTDFYIGPETAKPYLHPLRTADGKIVTRGFPMVTDVPGEIHDHPHHRGLWFTHGDVNGYDFWGNEPDQKGANKGKGKVVLERVDKFVTGKKSGTVSASFAWKIPSGETLLIENRKMTFYSDPQLRIIDFDITLSPQQEVKFGDTKEGMFAMRLAAPLEEEQPKDVAEPKRTGKMVNAQNKSGEKNVWGKRSEWVDYSGKIDGAPVGVAVFDHPSNPRYPTYWHARAYGLLATNIFGLHDFERDPSRDASLTIRPGQPLRFRYRVVIHPGDVNSAGIRDAYDTRTGDEVRERFYFTVSSKSTCSTSASVVTRISGTVNLRTSRLYPGWARRFQHLLRLRFQRVFEVPDQAGLHRLADLADVISALALAGHLHFLQADGAASCRPASR